ncbi:MAG: response regulator transcription factor [Alphaproteobacteria bacterium]|nr:response regulator transcription factor [Alphaproteobacteria bacterium]
MKILIADDHALFRDNLALYITEKKKDIVVMQVSDFSQALKLLEKEAGIDMIILDIDMTGLPAEKCIEKLHGVAENLKIVAISGSEDVMQIKKIINTGLFGYIPRCTDLQALKSAFDTILEGKVYIPKALEDGRSESASKLNGKSLTTRQAEVLNLIAEGKSNKQIAYEMNVSEATVKLHINALLRSLKVTNRTQAVITAQKIGLI